ncbi:MAG TPA: M14 family zinc carboxypeptidase [Anaerolineaceae bacterium]|nr:M14 family zinc carboxypeptidase [Anaerolineaceae bacterium]
MKRKAGLIILLVLVMLVSFSGEYQVQSASFLPTDDTQACSVDVESQRQVYRIYYTTIEDISRLMAFDVFEYNNQVEQYVLAALSPDELAQVQNLGFTTLFDAHEDANFQKLKLLATNSLDTIGPPFNCYRTVEELYAYGAALAAYYPTLAEWLDVGDSWEKSVGQPDGYDMMLLRLTNENITEEKPRLLLTASIHAREYAPAELAARFAGYLIENYNTNADVHWLLDYNEIYIMLLANPDGRKEAEAGDLWRKNTNENYCGPTSHDRGADLNRNFNYEWAGWGGSSNYPCDETYHGPSAASEPEVDAIQDVMLSLFPDQREDDLNAPAPEDATGVYIDLHSYGGDVMWSWGFTGSNAPNNTDLQTLGRKFAFFNGYDPHKSYTLYPTDGSTEDYIYGRLGVAGYCIEVGTQFFEPCTNFETTILPQNLPVLIYAAKTARTPYMTPAGPDSINLALDLNAAPIGTLVTLTGQINDTRFNNSNGTEPSQAIAAAEVSIDIPYWEEGYAPISLSPVDGNFNSSVENVTGTIDTSSLSEGQHILYVRGKDAAGNWGAVSALFLTLTKPVNNPPVAEGQELNTWMDEPIAITISGSDADGDSLTFSITVDPQHGSLSGTAPNVIYTPQTGYVGSEVFSFRVWDGEVYSQDADVFINVRQRTFLPLLIK